MCICLKCLTFLVLHVALADAASVNWHTGPESSMAGMVLSKYLHALLSSLTADPSHCTQHLLLD